MEDMRESRKMGFWQEERIKEGILIRESNRSKKRHNMGFPNIIAGQRE